MIVDKGIIMADIKDFPFNSEKEHELKLGSSFSPGGRAESAFHTIRYDFKPASVDTTKPAELTVGPKDEITVTVPHIQDSGATVYKGSKRSCPKECLLIIDKATGTFTLERIASTVPQLKKIRSAVTQPKGGKLSSSLNAVTASAQASPAVATCIISSPQASPPDAAATCSKQSPSASKAAVAQGPLKNQLSLLSTDSDSSSNDSSSSDSENEDNEDDDEVDEKDVEQLNNFLTSDQGPPAPGYNQLCEDLQLSESGSDSD